MDDGFQDDEEFSAASDSRSVAVVGGGGFVTRKSRGGEAAAGSVPGWVSASTFTSDSFRLSCGVLGETDSEGAPELEGGEANFEGGEAESEGGEAEFEGACPRSLPNRSLASSILALARMQKHMPCRDTTCGT